MNNNHTIIFHHIPKTAGTTFRSILIRQYNQDKVYDIWGDKKLIINNFKNMSKNRRYRYKLILGHQAFKLYDYINNPLVITMLRSPVARVISLYRYVKGFEWHPYYSIVNKYSLKECFINGIYTEWSELSNGQFNSLKNSLFETQLMDLIDIKSDENFIIKFFHQNIIFGLLESFDQSLLYFNKFIGFNNHIYYYKQKLSGYDVDIDDETIELIKEFNSLDIKLYV